MAITFVGSTSGQSGSGANVTLTLPAHATDDFGVIYGYADEAGGGVSVLALTVATGWTLLDNRLDTTGRGQVSYVWYKKFTSASETNPVMTNDLGEEHSFSVHIFRGVDTTTPFDAAFVANAGVNDTTPVNSAITTVTANAAVILIHGSTHNDITVAGIPTTPSGLALGEVVLNSSFSFRGQYTAYDLDVGGAAAITPTAWTHTSDPTDVAEWVVYTLALRPAAVAAGNPWYAYANQ